MLRNYSHKNIKGICSGSNNADIRIALIKLNKVFCLLWGQRIFDSSFVSDDGIEFNEVLNGDDCGYLALNRFGDNGFADGMEFGILIVGIDKDVCINQAFGQDGPRIAYFCQLPVFLLCQDGIPELSEELFLPYFSFVLFSFSSTRQNLLFRQPSQEEDLRGDQLYVFVSLQVMALLYSLFDNVFKNNKYIWFSQQEDRVQG